MPMTRNGLRIGEVAERAGVSVDTIRYYEKLKLLPRAPRSEGGFRLFTAETVERIQFIKRAKDMGFSLGEIKTLLIGGGKGECRQMRDLLQTKIAELDDYIKAMRSFRATLATHLAVCEDELTRQGDAATCPVIIEISNTTGRNG